MLKKIFQNQLYRNDISQFFNYIIGYVAVLFLNYGLNFLLNKKLSPEELGLFSYVQGLINILYPILCLAYYNAYLRFHKEHTLSEDLLHTGLPFHLFSALICAIVIAVITKSFIPLCYAMIVFFTEKQYILRVQMQIWRLNLLRCMELLIPLTIMFILFLTEKNVKASWVLFFYGIGFCTSFLFSPKSKLNQEKISKKDLFKYLFPVVGTSFITFALMNTGVIFAKNFFGLQGAAEWGVAFRAVMIYKSLTSIFLIFFPMLYFREAGKNNYRIINIYHTGIILFALIMILPFILFPDLIYTLLGAARYKESSMLLVYLIGGELFNFAASLYGLFFDFEINTWKNTLFKGIELALFLTGILLFAKQSLQMTAIMYLLVSLLIFAGMLLFGITQELQYFRKNQPHKKDV